MNTKQNFGTPAPAKTYGSGNVKAELEQERIPQNDQNSIERTTKVQLAAWRKAHPEKTGRPWNE